jgi:hypothetical protein
MPGIEKLYHKVEVLALEIGGTTTQLTRPKEYGAGKSIDCIDSGRSQLDSGVCCTDHNPGRTATARLLAGATGTETYFCRCSPVGPPCES